MKNKLFILAMLGIFSANFMHSDEVEEVIVQASLLNVTEDEIGDPLHILSGSDVSDLGTVSLVKSWIRWLVLHLQIMDQQLVSQ